MNQRGAAGRLGPLVRDGELVAALEEERFTRIKHCRGFAVGAIRESEPIVVTPGQAVDCFVGMQMDALVLHRTVVRRCSQPRIA